MEGCLSFSLFLRLPTADFLVRDRGLFFLSCSWRDVLCLDSLLVDGSVVAGDSAGGESTGVVSSVGLVVVSVDFGFLDRDRVLLGRRDGGAAKSVDCSFCGLLTGVLADFSVLDFLPRLRRVFEGFAMFPTSTCVAVGVFTFASFVTVFTCWAKSELVAVES